MSTKARNNRMHISVPPHVRRAMEDLLVDREFSWSEIASAQAQTTEARRSCSSQDRERGKERLHNP
jgi:hypothetical protein